MEMTIQLTNIVEPDGSAAGSIGWGRGDDTLASNSPGAGLRTSSSTCSRGPTPL
jgi:hypothetical protein